MHDNLSAILLFIIIYGNSPSEMDFKIFYELNCRTKYLKTNFNEQLSSFLFLKLNLTVKDTIYVMDELICEIFCDKTVLKTSGKYGI